MDYGYLAVIIGTFLEGETILIVAGFAAYEGYLELPLVITAAFFGSLFGDQLYFFIGRYKGQALLARFKSWEPRITRFRKLMDRHNTWFILIFRFLYGLRTPAPFAIGLSNVSIRKFIFRNIISVAIGRDSASWATSSARCWKPYWMISRNTSCWSWAGLFSARPLFSGSNGTG